MCCSWHRCLSSLSLWSEPSQYERLYDRVSHLYSVIIAGIIWRAEPTRMISVCQYDLSWSSKCMIESMRKLILVSGWSNCESVSVSKINTGTRYKHFLIVSIKPVLSINLRSWRNRKRVVDILPMIDKRNLKSRILLFPSFQMWYLPPSEFSHKPTKSRLFHVLFYDILKLSKISSRITKYSILITQTTVSSRDRTIFFGSSS